MTAIQTTARLEDARHLRLSQPLPGAVGDLLDIIVMVPAASEHIAVQARVFEEALGSYYREHPTEHPRSSDEWMAELREGDSD